MKKNGIACLIVMVLGSFSLNLFAQNVGVNLTGATPSQNAILDLNTGNTNYNLGFILPHIDLAASLSTFGMAALPGTSDTGLLAYNMNSGNQPIGVYYWNGTTWANVAANAWQLTGNSGTSVGTNYIGTNDSVGFEIKVNGKQRAIFNINQSCIGFGLGSLARVTVGHNNDAWGNYALASNTTGNYNSAVGGHALFLNTSGWGNNAHGHAALYSNTTGYSNSALGDSALYNNTSGSVNVALGLQSLYKNTVGVFNTAVGYKTLYSVTNASSVTAVGNYAGYSNLASRVCLFGDSAGYANTTGSLMAFGYFAGGSNTTGTHNTFIGNKTGQVNTIGSSNTAVGHFALYNSNSDANTAIGDSAFYSTTTGTANTAVGYAAGYSNTTGSNNTIIGNGANVSANNLSNTTALGYGALAPASNTMTLGNSSVVEVASSGNVVKYNPTLAAINATATASASQIISGYITSTSPSAVTITLPTAASLATALQGSLATPVAQGTSLFFTVDNFSGSNTVTVAVNTNITTLTNVTILGQTTLSVFKGNIGIFEIVYYTSSKAVLIRVE